MAEKEYIERDMMYKFIELFNTQYSDNIVLTKTSLQHLIDRFPSADVAPVHHGHWIEEYDCGYITPHCSECGETALTKEETSYDYVYSSYCPRCGAKLDKTE